MEKWIKIEGFENYSVSSFGNVRNNKTGKLLGIRVGSGGYNRVRLYGCDIKNKLVHRLVACAFISRVSGKTFVNHKDGNKLNNSVSNLEWCNHLENNTHKINILGKNNNKSIDIIDNNGNEYSFNSQQEAADILGLHRKSIYNIKIGYTIKGYKKK